MSATDGIAVHHSDDWLWQSANLHLHIEHAQSGHALLVDVATMTFHMHVATRAEGMLHVFQLFAFRHFRQSTREDDNAQVEAVAADVECLRQLPRRQRSERVAVAWTVDGDLRNVIVLLEEDFLEVDTLYLFPVSVHDLSYIKTW